MLIPLAIQVSFQAGRHTLQQSTGESVLLFTLHFEYV